MAHAQTHWAIQACATGEKMNTRLKLLAAALATVVFVSGLGVFFFEAQLGSAHSSEGVIRVACVGDSLTIDSDYPDRLGRMLGDNYTVGNFGVGGTTVSRQFRKPYLNQRECQNARSIEPDVVVMMLGTNDAYLSPQQRSNFTSDYETLIASFQTLPCQPEIFIVLPPPVFDNDMGLNATVLVNDVIPLVNQTANDLDLPLIDMYTPFADYPEGFSDGVHPNSEGSEIMATQVFSAIADTS